MSKMPLGRSPRLGEKVIVRKKLREGFVHNGIVIREEDDTDDTTGVQFENGSVESVELDNILTEHGEPFLDI